MERELSPPSPWIRRLRDIRGVRRELARVYGDARGGAMSWQDASRAANVLQILVRTLEGSDLEQRIAELEKTHLDGPT